MFTKFFVKFKSRNHEQKDSFLLYKLTPVEKISEKKTK